MKLTKIGLYDLFEMGDGTLRVISTGKLPDASLLNLSTDNDKLKHR
jgi:hypothetical protein